MILEHDHLEPIRENPACDNLFEIGSLSASVYWYSNESDECDENGQGTTERGHDGRVHEGRSKTGKTM
jgi:hypothetical protein